MLKFRETFHSSWKGGNLLNSYLKMNYLHFHRRIRRARPKFQSLRGQPLAPLSLVTTGKGNFSQMESYQARTGLGPPAPYNGGLIKICQLLSKLEYDRRTKFQCPGVRSQAGSGSGSTSSLLYGSDQIYFPISAFAFINGE